LAVNFSVPLDDLSLMIHAHPTLSEVLGETLLALTGRTLHG
jgi:dihydrolipoamide dehydrogenase